MPYDREAVRTEALRRVAKMLKGTGRDHMRKFGLDFGSHLGLKLTGGEAGGRKIDGEGVKIPIEETDQAITADEIEVKP